MALKTFVKVSNITNLSDARYCAGMEVDMLGFVCNENHPNFIPVAQFQDIRGWITGPAIVAEAEGLAHEQLTFVIENYKPDFLQVNFGLIEKLNLDIPLIVRFEPNPDWQYLKNKNIEYIILSFNQYKTFKNDLPKEFKFLIEEVNESDIDTLVAKKIGIALSGKKEISPGYQDFEALATILEKLEVY